MRRRAPAGRRYHYDAQEQLKRHLADFVAAYNFGRRLKTLRGLTPYEFICRQWTAEPQRFNANPLHQTPGLNIWHCRHSADAAGNHAAARQLLPCAAGRCSRRSGGHQVGHRGCAATT